MTRTELKKRMAQIDPESPTAVDELAALFKQDYLEEGTDLESRAADIRARAEADLQHYMKGYDSLLEKIHAELRKAGATEAQINWDLFGDVELPTISYLRCNRMAKKLIWYSYQITYCLGELKMIGECTDVDLRELESIRKEYRRRFG